MKYIISENQYNILLLEDRVDFLRKQFVIDPKLLDKATDGENDEQEFEDGDRPAGGMKKSKEKLEPIQGHDGVDIAYIVTNKKGKSKVVLTDEIFTDIVDADPTRKKEFVQWMVTVFMRHLKDGEIDQAIRFITEDLPEANEFLGVFDRVRKKKSFKRDAPNRPNAPQNVADITQYNDLAQLYSVVSPFMGDDDDENALWNKIKKHLDLGNAKLAYRDNDVLVYMPQTLESSCEPLGGGVASWCTANQNALNSSHDSSWYAKYRRNNPKPDGSLSDYYVVMPKTLFDGKDEGMFPLQFHFESGQLHDKNNKSIERSELPSLISKYPGLTKFFRKELGALATGDIKNGSGLMDSKYLTYLTKFGGDIKDVIDDEVWDAGVASIRKLASEQQGALQNNKYLKWLMENTEGVIITDYLDRTMGTIDFSDMQLKELPDLSEFTNLSRLSANNCGLTTLPTRNLLPDNIEVMSLVNNQLSVVPLDGWETLTNLFVANLGNNPWKKINVGIFRKLFEEKLARLVLDVDLENLTPENRKEYESLLSDADAQGYMVQ
jgi:hypothetical protein